MGRRLTRTAFGIFGKMDLVVPLSTIIDTMYRRVCPLYGQDERRRVQLLGSGVPFGSVKSSFLITAGHIVKAQGREPLLTWGAEGPEPLSGERIRWDDNSDVGPDYDLGLIALSRDEDSRLRRVYEFAHPERVSLDQPPCPKIYYLLAGYPAVRNRARARLIGPPLATSLVSGDIRPIALKRALRKSEQAHFALFFDPQRLRTVRGEPFRIPKPQGMSGGGVWRLEMDRTTRLATALRLVGIGIEYHPLEKMFVATRIKEAIPLAHDLVDLAKGRMPGGVVRSA